MRLVQLRVPHLLGVTVIGRDDQDAAGVPYGFHDAAKTAVDRLDGRHCSVEVSRMPDHVGIGEIADHHLVLALLQAASYIRLTRAQMLEELNLDHITTARAKGAGESRVVLRHGLRGALVPIVTLFGLDLGGLLGGAILTEKVFSMQGLGELLLSAVGQLDVAVVVGTTLFSAFLIILANLVVDVVHGVLDPRVSHG